MTTIKSFTDLQQSKVLAEFLPLESADMFYTLIDQGLYLEVKQGIEPSKDDIPCWSLAALLELIRDFQPNYQSALFVGKENGYQYMSSIDSATHEYNNPVDACVAMIENLHEQNLL